MDKKKFQKPDTKGVLGRLIKMLFREYPVQLIVVAVCIVAMSYASTIASIYLSDFITLIDGALDSGGGWDSIKSQVVSNIAEIMGIYAVGLI